MKPAIALLALFVVACGGGESSRLPTGPTLPPPQVERGPLFTYQNAVAYLPTGGAEYKAAIVFLPGLRDPATGNDLDSRALVRGTWGGACSIWCSPAETAQVRSRALQLVGGSVALIGTTTLVDDLVRRVASQGSIQIGEAADLHAGDGVPHAAFGRLRAPLPVGVAPTWFAFGEVALERAHVAQHQEHALLLRNARETFADGIALPEHEHVVIEEEHPGDRDAVGARLQLRQDQRPSL